jgi:hypothetical protein
MKERLTLAVDEQIEADEQAQIRYKERMQILEKQKKQLKPEQVIRWNQALIEKYFAQITETLDALAGIIQSYHTMVEEIRHKENYALSDADKLSQFKTGLSDLDELLRDGENQIPNIKLVLESVTKLYAENVQFIEQLKTAEKCTFDLFSLPVKHLKAAEERIKAVMKIFQRAVEKNHEFAKALEDAIIAKKSQKKKVMKQVIEKEV